MARTLQSILIDANSVLDLEAEIPTGDELITRANYANQAVMDAAATGQLSEFKSDFLTTTSTLATIPLPSDFREIQEWPRILDGSYSWQEYKLIEPEEKYDYSSGDRYAYVLGNPSAGYNLVINNIIADATLSIIYQRYPSGLLTLTDNCELSDPQVVTRTIEKYVLYSRSDDRFPVAKQMAEQQLANMMAREAKGPGGEPRDTKRKFNNPLSRMS